MMDGFGGGTNGYWRNRYYQQLDADVDDDHDHLTSGNSIPSSGRRRKRPSSRRPKVVKVVDRQLLAQSSPSTAPGSTCTSVGRAGIGRPTRRRRFWRIRMAPRLALLRRVATFPARLLRRIQHGYVRMMLKFAGAMGGASPEMAGYALQARQAFQEYDEKVLVDIYRALVAQGHVLVVPAAEPGTDGVVTAARLVAR